MAILIRCNYLAAFIVCQDHTGRNCGLTPNKMWSIKFIGQTTALRLWGQFVEVGIPWNRVKSACTEYSHDSSFNCKCSDFLSRDHKVNCTMQGNITGAFVKYHSDTLQKGEYILCQNLE